MCYMSNKISKQLILLLIFMLNNIIKADNSLEDKYYFQLFPSNNKEKPYLFYAYIPTSNLVTINSTEGADCNIIENKTVNEYSIKDLSSVSSLNDILLIKTCFGPDKIVELINKKSETFAYKKNNFKDNVTFCYTTMILDPLNQKDYVIMTYWTEFYLKNREKKYKHLCIIFNPITESFSHEIVLSHSSIIEFFINDNFFARECVTFRHQDIYCSINLNSEQSYGNSFTIDTTKIYTSYPQIHLIISTTDYGLDIYQKPIAIGKEIHDIFGGFFDAFLTEYHNKEENKTVFISTLFRKSLFTTFVPVSDSSKKYYGVNVEDIYIEPNLFNYLVPNQNDLIIIYLMQTRDSMGLIMTRFNLSDSVTYHSTFQEYSLSNYLQEGICQKPKYIQSIFTTSFINYSENDKTKINEIGSDYYYKYQKNIVSFISCEDENKNVFYKTKKINMPQCLNDLDNLNQKDFHTFKFKDDEDKKTIDIYNDPTYISLRNCTIEFFPIKVNANNPIIIRIIKDDNIAIRLNYNLTNEVRNPVKIEIFKTINFNTKEPLSIPYRIKYTSFNNDKTTCHLSSDICKFDIVYKKDDDSCDIKYCLYCEGSDCRECDSTIEGILLDKDNNRCICNMANGFQMFPKLFHSIINMCVCKEDYSFYKDVSLCRPNNELKNGSYYIDREDDVSSIPIYDDCPKDCLYCRLENNKFRCGDETDIITEDIPYIPDDDDVCLNNNRTDNTWFAIDQFKFIYAKIKDCVYIFENNSLFFYSNRSDCSFTNYSKAELDYISECLNKPELKNYNDYKIFLDKSKEYEPNGTDIFEEKENYAFHLVNHQNNSSNFSEIEISKKYEEKLKFHYNIDNNAYLLIFKVDIKRKDTISRQVEYQFYNPNPKKIYEKLNLSYSNPKRNTNSKEPLEIESVNISIPVDWTGEHLKYINELWGDNNIFLLNEMNAFYNDVCFKYKTPKNTDIYIQSRREKYYILEPLCESNCSVIDLNKENFKIKCNCPFKLYPESMENIKFEKKSLNDIFNKEYKYPNLKVIKCGGRPSVLFFITLILMIIFISSILHRKICGKLHCLKELQNQIGLDDDENQNLLNTDDDNDNEKEYESKKKLNNSKDNNTNNNPSNSDEIARSEINTFVKTTYIQRGKRDITNKKSTGQQKKKESINDSNEINNIYDGNNQKNRNEKQANKEEEDKKEESKDLISSKHSELLSENYCDIEAAARHQARRQGKF